MQVVAAPYPHEVQEEVLSRRVRSWLKDGAKAIGGRVVLVKAGSGVVIPAGWLHGARNVGGRVVSLNISVCTWEGFPSMLERTMKKAGRDDTLSLGHGIYNLARDYTGQLCDVISMRIGGAATLLAFMHAISSSGDIDNADVQWAKAKLHLLLEWCCVLAVLHASGTERKGQGRGGWIIGFDAKKAEGLRKKLLKLM